jgi:sulfoxide reductase heme-binding subunit YedZ
MARRARAVYLATPMTLPSMTVPWQNRGGSLSPLKLIVFLALFVPGLWTLFGLLHGSLGPRPLTEAIHQTGLWAVRFLLLSLAVSPLRRVLHWPRLVLVRRMIGVAAFAYALCHLTLYAWDQAFDLPHVASEILRRLYLTIGFATLLLLAALAATSTDGMIKRLGGRNWRNLHRLVYAVGVLALVHYFMQSKLNVAEPVAAAGLFLWLMSYRLLGRLRPEGAVPAWALLLLAIGAGLASGLGEALYYGLTTGVDPRRVLAADWHWPFLARPCWVVLLACLALAGLAAVRGQRRIGAGSSLADALA